MYLKASEARERQIFERKQKIRQLIAEGKPVPKELVDGVEAEGRSGFGGMGTGAALKVDEAQAGQ